MCRWSQSPQDCPLKWVWRATLWYQWKRLLAAQHNSQKKDAFYYVLQTMVWGCIMIPSCFFLRPLTCWFRHIQHARRVDWRTLKRLSQTWHRPTAMSCGKRCKHFITYASKAVEKAKLHRKQALKAAAATKVERCARNHQLCWRKFIKAGRNSPHQT